MDNVIAFTPRACASLPPVLPSLAGASLRAHLEEAAQTALDAADKIIAALDRIEGEADASLTAMAAHAGQVVHLRKATTPVENEPAPKPERTSQEPDSYSGFKTEENEDCEPVAGSNCSFRQSVMRTVAGSRRVRPSLRCGRPRAGLTLIEVEWLLGSSRA